MTSIQPPTCGCGGEATGTCDGPDCAEPICDKCNAVYHNCTDPECHKELENERKVQVGMFLLAPRGPRCGFCFSLDTMEPRDDLHLCVDCLEVLREKWNIEKGEPVNG